MTTEPEKAADEDPTEVAAPAPPPAAEPVRPRTSRRPSGRIVLALAGAFLAGAVCTGCVGVALVAVAHHHGHERGDDFRRHDRGDDRFRRDGDERGPRRVYPVPEGRPGRPFPPGTEVWPVPGDRLPQLPQDPNGPTTVPAPSPS
ncbi:hypothetical protein QEZ54_24135 [Catellatospora sp. KI3]|uniref:hypothetical protein n=1 Tax=Catellatospora sp. KI3 TaxID=3041620 RepID=UPI00248259DE|nr:hypothetical protein [Catellatospora sp. KI3]MDI1464080.1 hypothetical protein [Catellatospora sp. KI3]